ncbi:MAG: 16S rRNA (cytidine(1402)-2'-O)-methyltransferase [Alphaproteobacteria bacterium]
MPSKLSPGLYVTATPIGNLGDMTERAREILAQADLVVCEDTRVTGRLFKHFGIAAKLWAYHDHNAATMRPKIVERLSEGAAIALVSDAGTPLVSDPGYKLVRDARDAGIAVYAVPGPSALTAALSVAGLPTDRVFFGGFLPTKKSARREVLADLQELRATLVFFERGSRLAEALAELANALGDREASICRELTKMYEEVRHGTLAGLRDIPVPEARGEFVVVVGPPALAAEIDDDTLDALVRDALTDASPSRAAAQVAAATGVSRRRVYARALALAQST